MKKILLIMALAMAPFVVTPATNAPSVEITRSVTGAGSAEIAASAAVPLFVAGLVGLGSPPTHEAKKRNVYRAVC